MSAPELQTDVEGHSAPCGGYVAALVAAGDGYLSEAAIAILSPKQITVLYARMIEGRTPEETGKLIIGPISGKPTDRERVRQIQEVALQKLRWWVLRHNAAISDVPR